MPAAARSAGPAPPLAIAAGPQELSRERAQLLLRVLGEPTRLRVLDALADGERCVCELSDVLGLAQPKLSFHLKVMREAGVIDARSQGRWIYYRLQPDVFRLLSNWLDQLATSCGAPASPCS